MDLQGRTLAKRLKVRRRVKFSETWPLPMGVYEIISDGKTCICEYWPYGQGSFKSHKVFFDAINGFVRYCGFAVFEDWRNVDRFPFDWSLGGVT